MVDWSWPMLTQQEQIIRVSYVESLMTHLVQFEVTCPQCQRTQTWRSQMISLLNQPITASNARQK